MKRSIGYFLKSFLLILLYVNCCLPVNASTYRDVADSDWRTEAIDYVTSNSLMYGSGDGNFQPNQLLTRAQVVSLLYRLAGSPETKYVGQFQDVTEDSWYASAVSWACQQGIVHGTSDNTFSPLSTITREQLAVIINNYVKMTEINLQAAENNFLYDVKDCWMVSLYAESGVKMVCRTGIMNPDGQYNFNPKSNVTRGDAAVILMRLIKALSGERLNGMLIPNTAIDFSKFTQKEKDALALEVAQQIAANIPKGLSDLERVGIATWIVSHYSSFCEYTSTGKDYRTAYGVFIKGEYTCAGSTRALGSVLNYMGYQWKHINENLYTHQWCELYMDGQIGYADGFANLVGYGTTGPQLSDGNLVSDFYSMFTFYGNALPWPSYYKSA